MTDSINSIGSSLSKLQGLYPRGSSNLPGKSGVGQTLQANTGGFGDAASVELSSGDLLETGRFGILRVQESLTNTLASLDRAKAATEQVDIQLEKLDELAEAASDKGLDSDTRNAIDAEFTDTLKLIDNLTGRAAYADSNLLAGDQAVALATPDGSNAIAVEGADLSTGGEIITVGADNSLSTAEAAAVAQSAVAQSRENLAGVQDRLTSSEAAISDEQERAAILAGSDDETGGISVQVPSDSSGANDLAGQIGEALGAAGLSVSNRSPESVLTLFRA